MHSGVLAELAPKIILAIVVVGALKIAVELALRSLFGKKRKQAPFRSRDARNREKGERFEREVGKMLEGQGWTVSCEGIDKGKKDGGIDLIGKRHGVTGLIQCKCWKPGSLVRVNEVNQFFGAVELYKKRNPREKVEGIFVTTALLDTEAKRAAHSHGIVVQEKLPSQHAND